MPDLSLFPPNYFANLFLVMVRVGAMLFSAPLLQGKAVPHILKVGLSGLLAVLLVPMDGAKLVDVPLALVPLTLIVAKEVAVGVLIGYVINLVFAALQMAGQYLGLQIGFSLANIIDPLFSNNVSILDQLYTILASLIFLGMDGHHMLILAVQQTLDVVPLGTMHLSSSFIDQLTLISAGVFSASVRVALPVIATLLLTDVALGLMARTFPQMNIFVVGLPAKIFVGFFVLAVTLPSVDTFVRDQFRASFLDLAGLMRTLA